MSWLNELKTGDEVAIYRSGSDSHQIHLVDRVTKTMIILPNGFRFSKVTGREIGSDGWHFAIIQEVTDEIKKSIHRKRLVSWLKNAKWDEFSEETLEGVYKVIVRKKT